MTAVMPPLLVTSRHLLRHRIVGSYSVSLLLSTKINQFHNYAPSQSNSPANKGTAANAIGKSGERYTQVAAGMVTSLEEKDGHNGSRSSLNRILEASNSERTNPDLSDLRLEMVSRHLPPLYDYAYPTPSHLLSISLADYIPQAQSLALPTSKSDLANSTIPFSHHLVYFPPATPISSLLPDGTDPLHSPGPPFTRRMWAGGSMIFNKPFSVDERRAQCHEYISDVKFKGKQGDEKIFVQIEREISRNVESGAKQSIIGEQRTLVFMRDRPRSTVADSGPSPIKILKPPHTPDYTHVLTPTAALLFRFSALTFNAHRIHLDKEYCREIEGHRNLLVHGPLSLVLMLDVLQAHLNTKSSNRSNTAVEEVKGIEYRNLAPLYAEEEMKVCGREKGEGEWDVWVEGRDGGYAVKGLVKTTRRNIDLERVED